jgi:hypothetical protein
MNMRIHFFLKKNYLGDLIPAREQQFFQNSKSNSKALTKNQRQLSHCTNLEICEAQMYHPTQVLQVGNSAIYKALQ